MCEYCDGRKNLIEDSDFNEKVCIDNNIDKYSKALLELWGSDYDNIEINFCPMCGRDLNTKVKKED